MTEDKGMQPERSHAFQKKAEELSKRFSEIPHQIILTTSMIAEDLNISEYCIGHFFTNEKMALQFDVPNILDDPDQDKIPSPLAPGEGQNIPASGGEAQEGNTPN